MLEVINQQRAREERLREELAQTKNQYEESMKAIVNSTLESKLKDFFQEQKEYDRYEKDAKKPDLDRLDVRSAEEEVSRIFTQIEM